MRLLTDPMDAYVSLAAAIKQEVDRDVERGVSASLGEHVKVVEVLSERSTALCKRCEAVLQAVLAAAPGAPRGLRSLAHALTGGSPTAVGDGGDDESGVRSKALVALLFNSYAAPILQLTYLTQLHAAPPTSDI